MLGAIPQAGLFSNYVDNAGKHVDVLLGVGGTIATVPGALGPLVANHFFTGPSGELDAEPWLVMFHSAAVVLCVSAIVYSACASVPRLTQQRVTPQDDKDEEDDPSSHHQGVSQHNSDNSESDDELI